MRFTSKFLIFKNALFVYDLIISATKISWHDVLKYIANDISKYIFTYTLHVVNETKFDYEYLNVLLKIQKKNIHLTIDKDITIKFVEKIHQFNKQISINTSNELFKMNDLLNQFLFDNQIISRKKFISEVLFMHDQRSKMLKYHQDHDVFNEYELFKWQHFVLKKAVWTNVSSFERERSHEVFKERSNTIAKRSNRCKDCFNINRNMYFFQINLKIFDCYN
jgi:hypothetical protein